MPLFLQHTGSDFRIAIWQITETLDELLALLPRREYYMQESQRFKVENRRREWLSVRVLLYTLLGEEKLITYQLSGKPYLEDGSFSISISHTKGYACIMLATPGCEIGIDMELYGERVQRVADKFMRPDEEVLYYRGTTIWSLLLHWSAKETIYKCLDMEGVDFTEHLRIFPFTIAASGTFEGCEYKTKRHRRYRLFYCLFPNFVLTYTIGSSQ